MAIRSNSTAAHHPIPPHPPDAHDLAPVAIRSIPLPPPPITRFLPIPLTWTVSRPIASRSITASTAVHRPIPSHPPDADDLAPIAICSIPLPPLSIA